MGNIQLCPFGADGIGIDDLPEGIAWYDSPAAGKTAAQAIIEKYPSVAHVWVRKINDGHLRTTAFVSRV